MENCKICGHGCDFLFKALVLVKHDVTYYQCKSCKFIQTETPYWLDEAYSSAIGNLDIGLLYRNNEFAKVIPSILDQFASPNDRYLDYGGGYGVFVRMMRDRGFNFYLYDKYCENLFAKFFDIDSVKDEKFNAVTAFEVFEHLVDPIGEASKMLEFSDVIIFSTELQPDIPLKSENDWWYFVPLGGQHIALYHLESLKKLAVLLGCKLYTNGSNLHILSKLEITDPFSKDEQNSFLARLTRYVNRKTSPHQASFVHRQSLLSSDFEMVKRKLKL